MTAQLKQVQMDEFRADLPEYLDSTVTLEIVRDGQTVGYYLPAHRGPTPEEIRDYRQAVDELRAVMEEVGLTEDEVVREFRARRKGE